MKMRILISVIALTIISCNNQEETITTSANLASTQTETTVHPKSQRNKEICWTGTLNGKIPIFIHYQVDGNILVGEITYLNTRDKQPIKLLGTIEAGKSYRLLEFDIAGNITGVIEGTPSEKEFNGSWFSPKTQKELEMKLLPNDTLIASPSIKADPDQSFGEYHYQYGEDGYSGKLAFNKAGDGKAVFDILSLTNVERGPNIAEVEKDTIAFSSDSFIYKIPDSDSCEFKVAFYKGFAYINYTKNYCVGQFGLNATIDGIYLKTK
ncbi:hypothetical protein WG947_10955 [Pontibacter sp. H259]|uniref:hypothetical protein n=1 Tax=Pontibacter sp. H259 TaxID=3133421 RepID=UPI0030C5BF0C